jgi:hypothetical protein
MPWSTSYLPDLDVVMTAYCGVMSPQSLGEAVQATFALAEEHGAKKFLADCTTLEGGHSLVDLYGLVKLLEGYGLTPGLREAIVLPQLKAAATDVRFWETACRNRGFDVRVFESLAAAHAWLAHEPPGDIS